MPAKRKFRISSRSDFIAYGVFYNKFGYPCIKMNGRHVILHVFIWEALNGKKPKGFEIHHKDLDKTNCNPSNLELLTASDHRRMHFGWKRTGDKWTHKPCSKCGKMLPLADFYNNGHNSPQGKCKKCNMDTVKEWVRNNMDRRRKISRESNRRKRLEDYNRHQRTEFIPI